jgi:hypothetical protein
MRKIAISAVVVFAVLVPAVSHGQFCYPGMCYDYGGERRCVTDCEKWVVEQRHQNELRQRELPPDDYEDDDAPALPQTRPAAPAQNVQAPRQQIAPSVSPGQLPPIPPVSTNRTNPNCQSCRNACVSRREACKSAQCTGYGGRNNGQQCIDVRNYQSFVNGLRQCEIVEAQCWSACGNCP